MATSMCPKCGNHTFEIETLIIGEEQVEQPVLQCVACGAVVSVIDIVDTEALREMLLRQNIAISQIADALNIKLFPRLLSERD